MQRIPYRLTRFRAKLPGLAVFDTTLAERCTVFLGKNGAGKSLILEAIANCAQRACGVLADGQPLHGWYALDWSSSDGSPVMYGLESDFAHTKYREVCKLGDDRLWEVRDGQLTSGILGAVAMAPQAGLLATTAALPESASWLRRTLFGVRYIGAGVPRTSARGHLFLSRPVPIEVEAGAEFPDSNTSPPTQAPRTWTTKFPYFQSKRIRKLAETIAEWREADGEKWQEFAGVLDRVALRGTWLIEPWKGRSSDPGQEDGLLSCGGIDIGMLPDGTLRALEILVGLVDDATSVLIVEEPETGIHPGLLARILAEFDAYADDKQVVLSTHSPQVVAWARASELRLVRWEENHPTARSLTDEEAARAASYLNEEGDLGEFAFGGGLDE